MRFTDSRPSILYVRGFRFSDNFREQIPCQWSPLSRTLTVRIWEFANSNRLSSERRRPLLIQMGFIARLKIRQRRCKIKLVHFPSTKFFDCLRSSLAVPAFCAVVMTAIIVVEGLSLQYVHLGSFCTSLHASSQQ